MGLAAAAQNLQRSGFVFSEQRNSFWGGQKWVEIEPEEAVKSSKEVKARHRDHGEFALDSPTTVKELEVFFANGSPEGLASPLVAGALKALEQAPGKLEGGGYQAYRNLVQDRPTQLEWKGQKVKLEGAQQVLEAAYLLTGFGDESRLDPDVVKLGAVGRSGFTLSQPLLKIWNQKPEEIGASYRGVDYLGPLPEPGELSSLAKKIDSTAAELGRDLDRDTWQRLKETGPQATRLLARFEKEELKDPLTLLDLVLESKGERESLEQAGAPVFELAPLTGELPAAYRVLRDPQLTGDQQSLFKRMLPGRRVQVAGAVAHRFDRKPEQARIALSLLDSLPHGPGNVEIVEAVTRNGQPIQSETLQWVSDRVKPEQVNDYYQALSGGADRDLLMAHPDLESYQRTAELFSKQPEVAEEWDRLSQRVGLEKATALLEKHSAGEVDLYLELVGKFPERAEQVWDKLSTSGDLESNLGFFMVSGDLEVSLSASRQIHRRQIPGSDRPLNERRQAMALLLEAHQGEAEKAVSDYHFVAARPGGLLERAEDLARLVRHAGGDEARLAFVDQEKHPKRAEFVALGLEFSGSYAGALPLAQKLQERPERVGDVAGFAPLARPLTHLVGKERVHELLDTQLETPLSAVGLKTLERILAQHCGITVEDHSADVAAVNFGPTFDLPQSGQLAVEVKAGDNFQVEAQLDGGDWSTSGLERRDDGLIMVKPGPKKARFRLRSRTPNLDGLAPVKVRVGTCVKGEVLKIADLYANRHDTQSRYGETEFTSGFLSVPAGAQAVYQISPSPGSDGSIKLEVRRASGDWEIHRFYDGYKTVDERVDLSKYGGDLVRLRFTLRNGSRYSSCRMTCTDINIRPPLEELWSHPGFSGSGSVDPLLSVAFSGEGEQALTQLEPLIEKHGLDRALSLLASLKGDTSPERVEALSHLMGRLDEEQAMEHFTYLSECAGLPGSIADQARLLPGRAREAFPQTLEKIRLEAVDTEDPNTAIAFLGRVQADSDAAQADAVWARLKQPVREEDLEDRLRMFELLQTAEGKTSEASSRWSQLVEARDPAQPIAQVVDSYVALRQVYQGETAAALEAVRAVQEVQSSGRAGKLGLKELTRVALELSLGSVSESAPAQSLTDALYAYLDELNAVSPDIEVGEEHVKVGDFEVPISG